MIVIADEDQLEDSWFKEEIIASFRDINIEQVDPSANDKSAKVAVQLSVPSGVVVLG